MPASVEWFDDPAALAADPLGRGDRASLFDRLDWFALTVAHGLAGPPAIVRVREGGHAAWLFLTIARRRAAPLASWYSLDFGPVGAPRLFPALFRAVAARADLLTIAPARDPAAIVAAMCAAGWAVAATESSANRTIDLAGRDAAAWWAGRPGALRSTVARRARSHPVAIAIHDRFDAEAWAEYAEVYAASWKPAEGSLAFLRDLAEREGAAGTLRLGIARDASGRAVAAQLWLVEGGVATIHKLAHREDARAGSPGSLLSRAMFEHAIDRDRVARIDFGLGDEAYKADWMDDRRPVWRIDGWRPATVRGAIALARHHAGQLARRLTRR